MILKLNFNIETRNVHNKTMIHIENNLISIQRKNYDKSVNECQLNSIYLCTPSLYLSPFFFFSLSFFNPTIQTMHHINACFPPHVSISLSSLSPKSNLNYLLLFLALFLIIPSHSLLIILSIFLTLTLLCCQSLRLHILLTPSLPSLSSLPFSLSPPPPPPPPSLPSTPSLSLPLPFISFIIYLFEHISSG